MTLSRDTVSSEQLGHLGLIAAVIRELGIIENIDSRIALNEQKGGLVSYGRRVGVMILNGLGFMNSRLCMTTHFFQDKPAAQLLNDEISAEHLNDDCLGRCLDKIAEYGVTKLYAELAFEIAKEQGILGKRLHLDSTSFTLHSRYDVKIPQDAPHPSYGSKANRPDLKQVMLSLTQGGVANIHYGVVPVERFQGRGRPKPGAEKTVVGYQIEATATPCPEKVEQEKETLGRFILATNQLNESTLANPEVLKQYKEQSCVESGFKFIKNDTFELNSFYLNTPGRIGALMMIMTLCLMVYNFAQYPMRKMYR